MSKKPELIVMLTWHDYTVENALQVFEECKDSMACCWGMKEHSLPVEQMKELYARMRACGKTTFLEVVAYTEEEGLIGARMAAECGCDILMGTKYADSINQYCQEHGLKYMPFVGEIVNRPSVLTGDIDELVREAKECIAHGVYGINLLGYRYIGDIDALYHAFMREIEVPVCLAGSINSYDRLDEIKTLAPSLFTIGSAFFEHKFGQSISEQIDNVCRYMQE